MRISIKTLSATAATGLVAALAGAVPAHAATTITVSPGQSIQAAVNQAQPGDTIVVQKGTYHEAVAIGAGKDGLTLIGTGVSLLPPANPPAPGTNLCADMGDPAPGFCVTGDVSPPADQNSQPTVKSTLKNVTIDGFTVSHFDGMGVFGFGTENLTVKNSRLFHDGEYGIFVNTSTGAKIINNFAIDADEAGIYIGDSPNPPAGVTQPANATVQGNRSFDSGYGIFLRDASVGTVSGNNLMGNCVGLLALADNPGPSSQWTITGNHIATNVRECPATQDSEGGSPPLSGVGVLLAGATNNTVSNNDIYYNQPEGDSALSGGIVMVTIPGQANATAPSGNTISNNNAHGNKPGDIFWDGTGTGNTFTGNSCDQAISPNDAVTCGG